MEPSHRRDTCAQDGEIETYHAVSEMRQQTL